MKIKVKNRIRYFRKKMKMKQIAFLDRLNDFGYSYLRQDVREWEVNNYQPRKTVWPVICMIIKQPVKKVFFIETLDEN